jgi:hypothetical protein
MQAARAAESLRVSSCAMPDSESAFTHEPGR